MMSDFVVDEIKVEPRENQYGWSVGVLIEDKFVWVNGDHAKDLAVGDTVYGILVEKPYFKDGEQKIGYKLVDEHSKSAQSAQANEQLKSLEVEFNKLAKRVSALEEIVWPKE